MRKLGIVSLALATFFLVSEEAFAQRGRSSGGSSRSSVSSGGARSSQASRGSTSRSSGSSSRSSASRSSGSSSRSSVGRSSGSSSRSSVGRSSGSSSRSSGPTLRSSGSSSRSSTGRSYQPTGRSSGSSSRDSSYGSSRSSAPSTGSGPSLDYPTYDSARSRADSSGSAGRSDTGPGGSGILDVSGSRSERTRFPAPYRSSSSSRSAIPSSRAGETARSTSRDLTRLVDRYRRAGSSSADSRRGLTVTPSVVDRYGRSEVNGSPRANATGRGASALGLDSQRYATGPRERRNPAGTSSAAAGGGARRNVDLGRSGSASTQPLSGRAGAAEASTVQRPSLMRASRQMRKLEADHPAAARQAAAASGVLARSRDLALAAAVGARGGRDAGRAILADSGAGHTFYGTGDSYYGDGDHGKDGTSYGYGYYPWWGLGYSSGDWWFGFGSYYGGYGYYGYYGYPYWYCGYGYPYYYGYGYGYCPPYYYGKPYHYYYPYYYSTVVHHVYDDYYDDDIVIVVDDGDDVYVEEPVGEVVAGGEVVDEPAVDSTLRLSLNIAAERYLTLGDRAFREGRFTDAAQFYAKAVEYAPDEGVLHLVLADALFATGDYHYAAFSIRRAFELDPALADAIVDKHEFYSDPADFDRHLAEAELFLGKNPTDVDVRLVLATNYLFGSRPAAAVDLLEGSFSLSVRADTAAKAVLESARRVQYGVPTPEAPVEVPAGSDG